MIAAGLQSKFSRSKLSNLHHRLICLIPGYGRRDLVLTKIFRSLNGDPLRNYTLNIVLDYKGTLARGRTIIGEQSSTFGRAVCTKV